MRRLAWGSMCVALVLGAACDGERIGADTASSPDVDGTDPVDVSDADTTPADTRVEDGLDTSAADTGPTSVPCSIEGGARWTIDSISDDGPYFAGYIDLTVTDPDRKTAAHGIVPESDGRTVAMRVWYPAEKGVLGDLTPPLMATLARSQGPYPLLVHSHGFSSNKSELEYAAQWLATRGYVVAALEFPLTNLTTLGGPQLEDVVNQPADVRFALDELLARNALSSSPLYQGIDTARIAVSGVSLGGLTTLLTTYHRDWHDPRVKAAIDIAGPTGFFTPTFYAFVSLPVLLIYGDTDAIVDYAAHALPARARAPQGTRLMTLAGASHTGFAGAAALFESLDNPDSIGCSAITGQLPVNDAFLSRMVDDAIGIASVPLPNPCTLDPLPLAMRPSRQMLLTRLSIFAWLELQLGTDARRALACDFLETLDREADLTLE